MGVISIDEKIVKRARRTAAAVGKILNQMIREQLVRLSDPGHCEKSIAEFERLSGSGNSKGWRFDRDEIHERSESRPGRVSRVLK